MIGSFCSFGIVLWVIGQLGYNRMKINGSLKQRAFNTGMGTILRAFCCGVAMFVTKPKYSQVPEDKENIEGRLQGQEAADDDKGADQTGLQKDSELSLGPASLRLKG